MESVDPALGRRLPLAVVTFGSMTNSQRPRLVHDIVRVLVDRGFRVLVLAGSVLTAYVGIVGLVRRMALDRCLPDFFLSTNALRGTPHWIILAFFAVSASLVLALERRSRGVQAAVVHARTANLICSALLA